MKPIPADADISSGRVLRAFIWNEETFEPNRHLMADEVLAIPIANRRALVEGGSLEIYIHRRTPPLWNPRNEREKAALRAWFIEQLNAQDVIKLNRDQRNFLKWFATLPSRREAEKRTKWPQPVEYNQDDVIRQIRAAADKAQWRAGNPEPLRRHYPEIAETLQDGPRPEPGQHSAQARRKEAEHLRRRAQAIADYHFLSGLWGRRGRWTGKEGARLLAIEVAATRHGLPRIEVEKALRSGR